MWENIEAIVFVYLFEMSGVGKHLLSHAPVTPLYAEIMTEMFECHTFSITFFCTVQIMSFTLKSFAQLFCMLHC